jgi:hypothetical protein
MRPLFGAPKPPAWYREWRTEAFDELLAKQDRLEADFQLGGWSRYDYDLDAETLTFSDGAAPRVVAEIQAAGTTAERDWLWAWANASLPAPATEAVRQVKAFGQEHGVKELTSSSVSAKAPNELGWALTAVAARLTDADGVYRAPSRSGGALFLLIRSIRFVS